MGHFMVTICMFNGKEFDACIWRDTSDSNKVIDEFLSTGSEFIGVPMQDSSKESIALRRDHISSISVLKLEDI